MLLKQKKNLIDFYQASKVLLEVSNGRNGITYTICC